MDTASSIEDPGESQVSQCEAAGPKARMDLGLLIEAVQQFPYLYDLSSKMYKDAKKKHLAWQQIATLLNCSVDDCMKSWKNVRDRYVKEKKMNVGVSGAEAWESNWPYYDNMHFYSTFTKTRNTYTATRGKKIASQPNSAGNLAGRKTRPSSSSSVWSSVTMGTLTSPSPELPSQDEDESPTNAFSPVQSYSYRPSPSPELSSSPVAGCSYSRASSQAVDETLATETPRATSFRKPRVSGDDSALWQEDADASTSSTSTRKKSVPNDGLDKVISIANSLAQKIEQKSNKKKTKNAIFVEYLNKILEEVSEEEAGNIRRHILRYLCDNNLD